MNSHRTLIQVVFLFQERDFSKMDECRYGSMWVILTWLFGIISVSLLITLVSMCLLSKLSPINIPDCSRTNTEDRVKRSVHETYFRTNTSDVFEELSRAEIDTVVEYLHSISSLKLVSPQKASVDSNFIHSIEMKLPDKNLVTAYLEGQAEKPERRATVYIFRGADEPPSVDEYVVGGLDKEVYAHLVKTDRRQSRIPFIYRPFSTSEFFAIFRNILPQIMKQAGHVLKESYDALPVKCGEQCLRISMAPVSSGFLPEGRRKAWFWFQYNIEFPSVRPLDFQFLVDTTSVDATKWSIEYVWYANQMFPNMSVFLQEYTNDNINKTRLKFPTKEESLYGKMEFRTPLMPEEPLKAPRQFEPDGKRFAITGNEIHYMLWKLNFRVSASGGLHLLNIRFNDERIIYELSMQEVVVMYNGHAPAVRLMNFADGAGMYGTRYRGLLPGVDCPAHAQFVDTYLYTSNDKGGRIYENAFCVFELNTHTPIRRHRAYSRSGAIYGGLEGLALVVRAIISVVNYDYIFDFIFYQNGAIETKTSMTGYLATTFHFPEEDAYGTHVYRHVAAPLHNHLFHFKADLDIKGTANRYETIDIKTREETVPWLTGNAQFQTHIERNLRETEQTALYHYNFDRPKIHVFSNHDHISSLGNPRSYRIEIQKMSRQLIPEGHGFESGISWARYQMAVTKYWPEEERSSSLFTMWDARDPVVNFQKYVDDDDNIVDEVRNNDLWKILYNLLEKKEEPVITL